MNGPNKIAGANSGWRSGFPGRGSLRVVGLAWLRPVVRWCTRI